MVSITIFSILSLYTFDLFNFTTKKDEGFTDMYCAMDLICRDIMQADPNSVGNIFKVNNIHIGWEFKNNKLIRSEGIYNGKWIKRTQSTVCELKNFSITPLKNNQNKIVQIIKLGHDGKTVKRAVSPRNT